METNAPTRLHINVRVTVVILHRKPTGDETLPCHPHQLRLRERHVDLLQATLRVYSKTSCASLLLLWKQIIVVNSAAQLRRYECTDGINVCSSLYNYVSDSLLAIACYVLNIAQVLLLNDRMLIDWHSPLTRNTNDITANSHLWSSSSLYQASLTDECAVYAFTR